MSDVASTDHPGAKPVSSSRTARFGVFELDLRTGELRREGIRVPLQEQPFRLLSFLIDRAGEVVTREELRERLWPSEFVDFDHGLNTAIRKLRTALDDAADNPRFIETLARRGYRFIAPVSWSGEAAAPPAPASRNYRVPIAVAFAAAIIAAIIMFVTRREPPPTAPAPKIWAVAVLPFTYDDAASEHLGDGLTEILIDNLSRIPDVRVMASTTVFRYKGRIPDPRLVGQELDVGAVVTGDIRLRRDRYQIRVELVDVRDGSRMWGSRVDIPTSDLPQAQSRISDQLANHLRHGRRGSGAYTRNAEAYELYLRGLHAWNQRGNDNIRLSIEYFNESAELDPMFAAPYAGLANAWGVLVGNGELAPAEATPKIMAAARKALELSPDNAEAYTSMATTKFRNLWDFAGAEQDYQRALAINPNYATAHQWYSDYLRAMGRFDDARREIDIARQLDPLSRAITGAKCFSLFQERRYREAIAFVQRIVEIDPNIGSLQCILESYAAIGEMDNLMTILEQQGTSDARAIVNAYRSGGVRAVHEERLRIMLSRQKDEYHLPVEIAEVHALLGNREEAFRYLEIGFRHRVSRLTSFHLQPGFDSLRDDPRYDDLLKRIGLPRVNVPAPPS